MDSVFNVNGREFTFCHDRETKVNFTLEQACGDVAVYKIEFVFEPERIPEKIKLTWKNEATDVYSVFDPARRDRHLGYGGNEKFASRLASWLPLLQTVSKNGLNCALIEVEDVKTPVSTGVKIALAEEVAESEIIFFNDVTNPVRSYSTRLREDRRKIPFDRAVREAVEWYSDIGYESPLPPEKALMPMYSTWYSYLQNITADDVIKECREAVRYGMKSVIIDDGWQTADSGVLYGYTGDWKPVAPKFTDMRALTDGLHELGISVILWFSVPFVGYFSENHKKFAGKYLRNNDNINCSTLDPRYKEVRDFLTETYVDAVKKWNLDGLKLDFIDRFFSDGKVSDGMDFVSVEDATEQLLKDIAVAVKKIKPDIMIEFRQPYIGPVITAYGNMIRVWDCPLDPLSNRLGTLNLRLTARNCAVHSDMINWGREDSPESVASRLISAMFSVPQISVRLSEIKPEQRLALKNYLDFWNRYSEVITKGELTLWDPESNYSAAQAKLGGKRVAVGFSKNVFDTESCDEEAVFNVTSEPSLIIKNASGARYCVYDCMGRELSCGAICENLQEIDVPFAGRVQLSRNAD